MKLNSRVLAAAFLAWVPALRAAPAAEGDLLGLVVVEHSLPDIDGENRGVLRVVEVAAGSPAAKAGVRAGDILLGAGDDDVAIPEDLRAQIEAARPSGRLPLEVLRAGKPVDIMLRFGESAKASGRGRRGTAETAQASREGAGLTINGRPLGPEALSVLERAYGAAPSSGRVWYDSFSGLYGLWGREAAGFIRPGHDFGPLPAQASAGNTGIFLNGRQLNLAEAAFFHRLFGAVYPGQWWLDGRTGNVGLKGSPLPAANIFAALQQAQSGGGGGGGGSGSYRWSSMTGSGGVEGRCVWVNVPGASVMGSGCD
jgi:membrane-associated protease RseP (regulator of RpoE activity)